MLSKSYISHYKKNFHLAYPVALSHLGHIVVDMADSIMVGQTGKTALAAASFGINLYLPFLVFGIGLSFAITPLVANAFGRGDSGHIGRLLKNGLLLYFLTGILLTGLVYAILPWLEFFDQPDSVLAKARPFIMVLALSAIPLMVFQTFKQYLEGMSVTRQAMYISVSGNLLNILLNYLLIFGKLGLPAFGLMGAAYASLFSRTVMAISIGIYALWNRRFNRYLLYFYRSFHALPVIKKMLGLGFPIGIQFVFETAVFAITAIMAGWLGENALAAHQIAFNLASATYMLSSGIGAAATIRIGQFAGANDFEGLKVSAYSNYLMAGAIMLAGTVLFLFARDYLPALYVEDPVVRARAADLLLIAAFFQLFDGLQVTGQGILRGMKDVKVPTMITIGVFWGIGLPLGYFLGFKNNMGIEGIWLGVATGLVFVATLYFIRFRFKSQRMASYS